jgi:lipoyl synthase
LSAGGAAHFAQCIKAIRDLPNKVKVEVLVPDFRGRLEPALEAMADFPPDVFNHNLETVPRLYKQCRPGADYAWSLNLLKEYKKHNTDVMTKSGLMLGLGETNDEIVEVLKDLRAHDVDMLTLGQYLQPSKHHLPVKRFVHPDEFTELENIALKLGFKNVAAGAMVRSSYHADLQASEIT